MVHILLLILKIIGIILGVALGVSLLSLCLALFVPVRYTVEAQRTPEEGSPPIEASAKITWLLYVVNIRVQYATELRLRARIFVFTVFRLPRKAEKKKAEAGKKKSKSEKKPQKKEKALKAGNAPGEERVPAQKAAVKEESTVKAESTGKIESAGSSADKTGTENAFPPENPPQDTEKAKKHPKFSIKEFVVKICRIFRNIWYTITGICDKIKKIWENIEYYLDVLQSDAFQQSYALCKEELGSIFSYIKPRKFQADLIIGMGDPAATAKILSYYGMLYPLIGGNVNIVPDFDEKRIEGKLLIKGKIKLFTFLRAALHIYFSKDIKKLLKLFKKEDI